MLGVSSYPKTFVDGCRSRIEAQLATYDQLLTNVPGGEAVAAFEHDRVLTAEKAIRYDADKAVAGIRMPAAGPQVVRGLPSASQARLP